jgi:hypothetical protein
MTMLASMLALTLAAVPPIDAHRALQTEQLKARTAASELYHYATHNLDLVPEVARKITADISRAVGASADRLTALRDGLSPTQRSEAATELQLMADWHGKAAGALGDLKNEVAKASPDGREIRFHTSAVYGALAGAAEAHERLMQRLDVKLDAGETATTAP